MPGGVGSTEDERGRGRARGKVRSMKEDEEGMPGDGKEMEGSEVRRNV